MSTKLVKRLLRQTCVFDETPAPEANGKGSVKSLGREKKRCKEKAIRRHNLSSAAASPGADVHDPVQFMVGEMLRYDRAISRHSDREGRALKRRLKNDHTERRRQKKARASDGGSGSGHSRGSSAPRLELEPTFNKKNEAKKKEMKSIEDLAKMLQKSKKKKRT